MNLNSIPCYNVILIGGEKSMEGFTFLYWKWRIFSLEFNLKFPFDLESTRSDGCLKSEDCSDSPPWILSISKSSMKSYRVIQIFLVLRKIVGRKFPGASLSERFQLQGFPSICAEVVLSIDFVVTSLLQPLSHPWSNLTHHNPISRKLISIIISTKEERDSTQPIQLTNFH